MRLRWFARALIVIGAAALAWSASHMMSAAWFQRQTAATLESLSHDAKPGA